MKQPSHVLCLQLCARFQPQTCLDPGRSFRLLLIALRHSCSLNMYSLGRPLGMERAAAGSSPQPALGARADGRNPHQLRLVHDGSSLGSEMGSASSYCLSSSLSSCCAQRFYLQIWRAGACRWFCRMETGTDSSSCCCLWTNAGFGSWRTP